MKTKIIFYNINEPGKVCTTRRWSSVPRIDETINISTSPESELWGIITNVVWRESSGGMYAEVFVNQGNV